jgi:hypothetical protein
MSKKKITEKKKTSNSKEDCMKKIVAVAVLSGMLGFVPVLAQEKKEMPMKQGMPMNHEGMQGGSMTSGEMKEMHDKMTQIKKGMAGMMKDKGMMKSADMKGMGQMMGNMSAMMGDMGHMMDVGKMSQNDMENMSQVMGDMSGMMKQMSERMKKGMEKTK